MIRTYNIISEIDGEIRILDTFEVEGSLRVDMVSAEMIEDELYELADKQFKTFKSSLYLEEEE